NEPADERTPIAATRPDTRVRGERRVARSADEAKASRGVPQAHGEHRGRPAQQRVEEMLRGYAVDTPAPREHRDDRGRGGDWFDASLRAAQNGLEHIADVASAGAQARVRGVHRRVVDAYICRPGDAGRDQR